jgi:hypothetical protein
VRFIRCSYHCCGWKIRHKVPCASQAGGIPLGNPRHCDNCRGNILNPKKGLAGILIVVVVPRLRLGKQPDLVSQGHFRGNALVIQTDGLSRLLFKTYRYLPLLQRNLALRINRLDGGSQVQTKRETHFHAVAKSRCQESKVGHIAE